jgi:hypothetical protein
MFSPLGVLVKFLRVSNEIIIYGYTNEWRIYLLALVIDEYHMFFVVFNAEIYTKHNEFSK